MRYKYTETEIDKILDSMVVLIDTREQKCEHIKAWLEAKKRPYKITKVDLGDYSCYIPNGSFKGQTRDIYFTDDIVIERKSCIDELAMNLRTKKDNLKDIDKEAVELLGEKYLEKILKSDYMRLKQEFTALNKYGTNFVIYIEDENYLKNLKSGNYRSKYEKGTLYKRLKALEREFKTLIMPVSAEDVAAEIYNTLRYAVRDILKNKGYFDEEE